jgi:hypothetical protein
VCGAEAEAMQAFEAAALIRLALERTTLCSAKELVEYFLASASERL